MKAVVSRKGHVLGIRDRLASRDDEQWLFLEDPNQEVHETDGQVKVEYDQGEDKQEKSAAENAQRQPYPKHRCSP